MTDTKMKDLRAQAKSIGMNGRKGESKESLMARLTLARQTIDQRPTASVNGDVVKAVPVKHYTAPEQLLQSLEPFKGKGIQIKIDESSETWHFKYGVAEDSGTLHQPLSVIKRMAEMLLRARMPAKIKTQTNEVVLGA